MRVSTFLMMATIARMIKAIALMIQDGRTRN